MGGLEVVFRCHTSGCFMFFCKDLQKIMDHGSVYISLFCGNLITIDYHDNLDRWTDSRSRRVMMASELRDNRKSSGGLKIHIFYNTRSTKSHYKLHKFGNHYYNIIVLLQLVVKATTKWRTSGTH